MATVAEIIAAQGTPEVDGLLLDLLNAEYTDGLDDVAPDGGQLIVTTDGNLMDPEYTEVLKWSQPDSNTLVAEVNLAWGDGTYFEGEVMPTEVVDTILEATINIEAQELSIGK